MGDPPPTATSAILETASSVAAAGGDALRVAATAAAEADAAASAAASATASAAAARSSVVGLGCTLVKVWAGRQASARMAVTSAMTGPSASAASVTTTTWSAPVARTMPGSFSIAPTPKCASGFGVITKGSIVIVDRYLFLNGATVSYSG